MVMSYLKNQFLQLSSLLPYSLFPFFFLLLKDYNVWEKWEKMGEIIIMGEIMGEKHTVYSKIRWTQNYKYQSVKP